MAKVRLCEDGPMVVEARGIGTIFALLFAGGRRKYKIECRLFKRESFWIKQAVFKESNMSKLLYIKASPMKEWSYSAAVADAFVEAYKTSHPKDEVKVLDLYSAKLPEFDFVAASGKYKIMHGKTHSAEEKAAWQKVVAVIEEFKNADKYVMAVPMWNFSIPYRLKQYIDIIVQPGLTFTVDSAGNYKGLVTGKPVFVSYARGGEYSSGGEAFDMQKKYLELILGFIGLTDVRSVVVEPTLTKGSAVAEQKRAAAIEQARQNADTF
jgi:FMN-dependent NADH-azoreductase